MNGLIWLKVKKCKTCPALPLQLSQVQWKESGRGRNHTYVHIWIHGAEISKSKLQSSHNDNYGALCVVDYQCWGRYF